MTQESKISGHIYCLVAPYKGSNLYFLRYKTLGETLAQVIEEIENKLHYLRGSLSLHHQAHTSDIKKAKNLIDSEVTPERLSQEIADGFVNPETHDIPFIRANESFGLKLTQVIEKASNESKQNEGLAGLVGCFLLLFILLVGGSGFLIPRLKQSPNIQNFDINSPSYTTCVNGGGGRACKKLTNKAYQKCQNNGGGTACEKLIK